MFFPVNKCKIWYYNIMNHFDDTHILALFLCKIHRNYHFQNLEETLSHLSKTVFILV